MKEKRDGLQVKLHNRMSRKFSGKSFVGALLCLFLLMNISVSAQQKGKLELDKLVHDFGEIKEEEGRVEAIFKVKNVGEGPMRLTSVKASCGCTTPEWERDTLFPADSGRIRVTYNPDNRPGNFDKGIVITTDGNPSTQIIRIKGTVIPKPKGPDYHYPFKEGNIRFKTNHLAFGTVMHDEVDSAFTILYNESDKPIHLDPKQTLIPPYIRVIAKSRTIPPKDTLRLKFQYNSAVKKDWGFNFEYFFLVTDDPEKPNKRINVSAEIKENFHLSATEKQAAPRIVLDRTMHDFNKIEQSKKVFTSFELKNTGNSPLILRKVKASCGCTVPTLDTDVLEPGESTTMEVSFNPGTREGKQQKEITIVANDPKQPVTVIRLLSDVQVP